MQSNLKAAWARIRERIEAGLAKLDEHYAKASSTDSDDIFAFFFADPAPETGVKSINDEIQTEYRSGRITEDERNQMRAHVREWMGDPEADRWGEYATYACGLWAPSAAPFGITEHQIILASVVILEEESQ